MGLIRKTTATKTGKFPVYAGMKMISGKQTAQNKISKVGYRTVKFFYSVFVYESGHKDYVLVGEKTIKTVITK